MVSDISCMRPCCFPPAGATDDEASESEEEQPAEKDAAVIDVGVSDLDYLRSRMKSSFGADEAVSGRGAVAEAASGSSEDEGSGGGSEEEVEEAEPDAGGSDEAAETAEAADTDADDERRRAVLWLSRGSIDLLSGFLTGICMRWPRLRVARLSPSLVSAGEVLPILEACSSGQCMGCITSPPDLTVRTVYAGSGEGAGPAPQVVQASETGAAIADTGRLFLRNLSYAATETDLTELLQPYGDVTEVHLVLDKCALLNPLGDRRYTLQELSTPAA